MRDAHTAQISAAELKGRVEALVEQQAKLFAVVRPEETDKVVLKDKK